MALPITSLTAAVLGLLLVLLAIKTIQVRVRHGVAFGDGGHAGLIAATRAHGNHAEYAPIGVILIGLLEAAGVYAPALGVAAAAFVAARIVHSIGLFGPPGPPPNKARSIGIVLTLLILIALALWLAVATIGALGTT